MCEISNGEVRAKSIKNLKALKKLHNKAPNNIYKNKSTILKFEIYTKNRKRKRKRNLLP